MSSVIIVLVICMVINIVGAILFPWGVILWVFSIFLATALLDLEEIIDDQESIDRSRCAK